MLFPREGSYMLKNTKDILKKVFFPIIYMGAIRYSCPIRLVPTYILHAKKRSFSPIAFKLRD